MEKIIGTDRVRKGEVLQIIKEESYILKKMKDVYWIYHILSKVCLPSTLRKGGYKGREDEAEDVSS